MSPAARPNRPKSHLRLLGILVTSGAIGSGVAIGDFDGDDRPDVFVVSKTGPNHLFRNLGDFRFKDVTATARETDHAFTTSPPKLLRLSHP